MVAKRYIDVGLILAISCLGIVVGNSIESNIILELEKETTGNADNNVFTLSSIDADSSYFSRLHHNVATYMDDPTQTDRAIAILYEVKGALKIQFDNLKDIVSGAKYDMKWEFLGCFVPDAETIFGAGVIGGITSSTMSKEGALAATKAALKTAMSKEVALAASKTALKTAAKGAAQLSIAIAGIQTAIKAANGYVDYSRKANEFEIVAKNVLHNMEAKTNRFMSLARQLHLSSNERQKRELSQLIQDFDKLQVMFSNYEL